MRHIDTRLTAIALSVLVAVSMFAATVTLSGMAAANATGVALDDGSVSAGTPISGATSLDSPESYLHVALDANQNGTFDGDTRVVTISNPTNPQNWDGLDTSGLAEGSYTIHAWDDSSESISLSTGAAFPSEAVTTTLSVDNTAPTTTITSLNQSTVTAGENITVDYDAIDDAGTENTGVASATLAFVDAETGNTVKETSVTAESGGSQSFSAPTDNGSYDLRLTVTDAADNTATDDETVVVDTTAPSVGVLSPDDGAERTSLPSDLVAKANDNVGVDSVEFRIEHDGEYYTGDGWQSGEAWVTASYNAEKNSWEYAATDEGITDNGTYTVVARATDEADTTTTSTESSTTSTAPLPPTGDDDELAEQPTYTVDLRVPSVTSVTVSTADNDGVVAAGDDVTVSATVTDATSGVGTVTVDASALGESSSLELTHDSGDTYSRTFTVQKAAITVPDGPHALDVTATDAFGQSNTRTSNEFTVDTAAAAVEDITIQPGVDSKFVGVVDDSTVRVTATNITDANGNLVTVGTVEISIGDETPFDPIPVSDSGDIDATIDPTKLPDDISLVGGSAEVAVDGAENTMATVELVHEARTLTNGWHLTGTPLPAESVSIAGEGMMYRYDTSAGDWAQFTDTGRMESPGAGYYINVTSDEARVGYVYEETSGDYTRTFETGYNLVGVVADVDEGDTESSLGKYVDDKSTLDTSSSDRITYHVENPSESDGDASVIPFTDETDGSDTLSAYSAYFVEVTEDKNDPVVITIPTDGYDS